MRVRLCVHVYIHSRRTSTKKKKPWQRYALSRDITQKISNQKRKKKKEKEKKKKKSLGSGILYRACVMYRDITQKISNQKKNKKKEKKSALAAACSASSVTRASFSVAHCRGFSNVSAL